MNEDDDTDTKKEKVSNFLIISETPNKWNKRYETYTIEDIYKNKDKKIDYFQYILIDESINIDEIKSYEETYKFNFYNEIIKKYMNQFSVLMKPQMLYHDFTNKLYLLGIFRFRTKLVYNIYSKYEFTELHTLITNTQDILQFKVKLDPTALLQEENAVKLKLAKERKMKELHQKGVEIKTEVIRTVKDYNLFIKNRSVFSNFMSKGITDMTRLRDNLRKSEPFPYSHDIFKKISEKYNNDFPYNIDNPLYIYYVIILHNQLIKDKLYESYENIIASNIGVFSNDNISGIIIQSVTFKPIQYYDAAEILKINNNDNYYIWMKPETSQNGINMYQSHIKSFQFIKNNLKKKNKKMGGTKKKNNRIIKTKTYSNKIK